MLSLLLHELRVRRGGIIGWSLGLSIYAGLYTAFYPALPDEMMALDYQDIELFQLFGEMNMATFESYMGSSVFNFLGVLLGIFAVISGVGILAGEEDNGTLEQLVTLPLRRWQLVLAKALALAIAALIVLAIVGLVIAAVFTAVESQVETTVTAGDLFLMTLAIWPLALVFMLLSLFLGALLPSRRAASAAAATLLVAAFFGNNLAGLFDALRPVQLLSPFNYYDSSPRALQAGFAWSEGGVLLAAAVVFLLLTVVSFGHRDITVGRWSLGR